MSKAKNVMESIAKGISKTVKDLKKWSEEREEKMIINEHKKVERLKAQVQTAKVQTILAQEKAKLSKARSEIKQDMPMPGFMNMDVLKGNEGQSPFRNMDEVLGIGKKEKKENEGGDLDGFKY